MVTATFICDNRNTRCFNVNRRLCGRCTIIHTIFRRTSTALNCSITRLYFRRGSGLRLARCARPTVLAIDCTLSRLLTRGKVRPSFITKLDLKRCATLIGTGTFSFGRTVSLMTGHKGCVDRTIPTNHKGVTTIVGTRHSIVRRSYQRTDRATCITPTGCGVPARVIVNKRVRNISGTVRVLRSGNIGHVVPLGIDNPFRATLLRPTTRGLRMTLSRITISRPGVPIINGARTAVMTESTVGNLLIHRVRSPML